MTITARMAKHLDDLATEIMGNYRPARRQLEQWTGEYRSAVIGAAPDSSPPSIDQVENVHLTTVERQALSKDKATYTLEQMHSTLVRAAGDGRSMWGRIDGVMIPEPANTDPSQLAVMMWAVMRCQPLRLNGQPNPDASLVSAAKVRPLQQSMTLLAGLCKIHLPPPPRKITDCCHAHAAAGLEAEISPNFRRFHLCEWCGRQRSMDGTNPVPAIVRMHDRGIKITPAIKRRHGVKVA